MHEDLLSTQAAAELVASEIHEAAGVTYWARYLTNNRRDDRNPPHRVSFQRLGACAFYRREDLAAFIEFEKKRRLGIRTLSGRAAEVMRAYGIGEAGGGTTGRRLDCTINPQVDPVTGAPYVQLVINDPLLVYRVDIAQAKALCTELAETIAAGDRAAS